MSLPSRQEGTHAFDDTLPSGGGSSDGAGAPAPGTPAPWDWPSLCGRLIEISGGPATAVLTVAFRLVREAQARGEPAAWITGRSSSFFPPDAASGGIDLDALAVIRLPGARRAPPSPSPPPSAGPSTGSGRPRGRGASSRRLPFARPRSGTGVFGQAPRAADHLLRSGGFGLVVLDLVVLDHPDRQPQLPLATQTRLAGLAKRHHAILLCLTARSGDRSSLGSLVSLRLEARREVGTGGTVGTEEMGEIEGTVGAGEEQLEKKPCRWSIRALKDKRRGQGWSHGEACRAPSGLR